eukprot:scaffold12338_cov57-Cyclotella_meneghiniana.AAC.1
MAMTQLETNCDTVPITITHPIMAMDNNVVKYRIPRWIRITGVRPVTPSCFLCVVIGCCGLMDDGSVQKQRRVIGRNVYRHEGDDNGKVSVNYLKC